MKTYTVTIVIDNADRDDLRIVRRPVRAVDETGRQVEAFVIQEVNS